VDIGQIQFPKEVADAISRKIAKKQELERQEFVLAKTRKEAAIRVLEALKMAKQQRIISSTLDPLFLQQRAVQVYKTLGHASNRTIIMLPQSPEGTGLPLVQTHGKRKVQTPEDEQLLEDMEKRYMHVAKEPAPSTEPKSSAPAPAPAGTDAAASPAPAATPPAAPAAPAPAQPAPGKR